MSTANLTVSPRPDTGKQAAKKTRAAGFVPAVLYGPDHEPQTVQVSTASLKDFLLHGSLTSVVDIAIEGAEDCKALLRDPVTNPVTGEILHIDFLRVTARSRVHAEVPVELVGTPEGVKEGGVLDQIMRTLNVECMALEIPEKITIDVSALLVNENISVSDIDVPGVKILIDETATIAAVSVPAAEVEEVEEAEELEEAEEGAEPEIVGQKGKGEDEEESDEE